MKPRIRLKDHVWSCVTLNPWKAGYGYSPADAYWDWWKQ